jgi:tetratricopeptide (TPR) repeat protein
VKNYWIGLLGALIATGAIGATNEVVTGTNAPAQSKAALEQEFQKVMELDDAAQAEIDGWIKENEAFAAKGAGMPALQMRQRIRTRLEPVDKAYAAFIQQHPDYVKARVAYASFLGDVKGEEAAEEQLEAALARETNDPAIYNNLANIYGHIGPIQKAFEYYDRAVQLNPLESTYYHNLGTAVYLFRPDAEEYYHLSEQQVFAKAFNLYSNAMRLDPENFPLASDVAQSWYGLKPLHTEEALRAWTNAYSIAHDEIEREGVQVHFARVNFLSGRFKEARAHLELVTNAMYAELKAKIATNIITREKEYSATNSAKASKN